MLWYKGKQISAIAIAGKMVATMWYQGKLIYQTILSCFGSGVWIGSKPWIGTDTWKSNKS